MLKKPNILRGWKQSGRVLAPSTRRLWIAKNGTFNLCYPPIRRTGKITLAVVLLLCSCAGAWVDVHPRDAPLAKFNFEVGSGRILAPVSVEGRSYSFILDTGSSHTAYDVSLRPLLGKRKGAVRLRGFAYGRERAEHVEAPQTMLGELALHSVSGVAVCVDLGTLARTMGTPVAGILGMDMLRAHVLRIDFDRGEVTVLNASDPSAGRAVPLRWRQHTDYLAGPFLDAEISGLGSVELRLDTGYISRTSARLDGSIFQNLLDRHVIHPVDKAANSALTHSQCSFARGTMSIGGYRNDQAIFSRGTAPILSRGAAPNLVGTGFLSRFVVTLDFPKSVLYLREGKGISAPDGFQRAGLVLQSSNGRHIIKDLAVGSPADEAGLRRGDVIVAVDGVAVGAMSKARLVFSYFCDPLPRQVTILRGHTQTSVVVDLTTETETNSVAQ